ncbi:MAG: NUDIX hydrolase [Flavobacteriaceae bacterium]|nr:MAG: NUDIX hydrolase [Flavobacteriaceae bacterium]
MDYREFLEHGGEYYLPNLSIDLVIVGYEEDQLKCLLLQIGEKWLLPGGYVGKKESVDDAAVRILRERTGLGDPHLKFLSVFGNADRHFRDEWKEFVEKSGQPWNEDYWFNDRFVSLAYYSLVQIERTHPVPGKYDQAVGWFAFGDLPPLWMDHQAIALGARNRLKEDVQEEHLTHKLLPEKFTMPELHQLHQAILEEKIDRSRFQKKMLASGIYKRLPKLQKETPGRNPFQYTLKSKHEDRS